MNTLLIGEASNQPHGRAFWGHSGIRLAKLAKVDLKEFHELFECINLLGRQEKAGKGFAFDAKLAKSVADEMNLGGRHVLLVGLRVAKSFGLKHPSLLTDVLMGRGEISCHIIPHPSGIVRWWNDSANVEAAGKVMEKLACAAYLARS